MSHDRGCRCGREKYEYDQCDERDCDRRDNSQTPDKQIGVPTDKQDKEQPTVEPTFYILIRRDLHDYNPGKAMAQAAHAQAMFDFTISEYLLRFPDGDERSVVTAWKRWKQDNGAFGRTVVVHADLETIYDVCAQHKRDYCGIVVDPSYPWKNWYGETLYTSEVTAGYILVDQTHLDIEQSVVDTVQQLDLVP